MNGIWCDPSLLSDVRRFGRFDTNACLQCGSCTLSCELSGYPASFPRRTLRLVLLGLREPLRSNLEPWLCHYCGECSTTCPRDAEPAQSMMTLRRYLAAQYDWTGLSSLIHRSSVGQILALVAVAAAVLLLTFWYHSSLGLGVAELTEYAESIGLEHMFGDIATYTRLVFLAAVLLLLINAARMFWFTMYRGASPKVPLRLYLTQARVFLWQGLTQRRIRECPDRPRWVLHLLLVAGVVLMIVIKLFALSWFQTDELYPLYHPQRWVGYLAAGAILIPIGTFLAAGLRARRERHRFSEPTDWTLLILLLITALTGILIHILRYMELAAAAHYMYAAHLAVAVPMLLVELPFGKWSHALYGPLAIYLQAVRDRALEERAPTEAVSHAA
jgi:heterodisulfide reductase subunit C/quinone-modifying oxidoreductase subunit QmoC